MTFDEQVEYLRGCKDKLGVSWEKLSELLDIDSRSIRNYLNPKKRTVLPDARKAQLDQLCAEIK